MDWNSLSQYTVVGLTAVLIVRDFLKYMREKQDTSGNGYAKSTKEEKYAKLQKQVDELHTLRKGEYIQDRDTGMQVWYGQAVLHKLDELLLICQSKKKDS